MTSGLEHLLIISWHIRFEKEYLYQGSCLLTEMKACMNHLGIIEYHKSALRKILRYIVKNVLRHFSMTIEQQLAVVTLCKRKLSYALVRKIIVKILYLYVFCIHFL